MITREMLLKCAPRVERVEAFGGDVFVREMRGNEVSTFQKFLTSAEAHTGIDVAAELLARTLCDEQGTRMFTDAEAHLIAQQPGGEIQRAYEVAERLNTLTEAAVVDAEKN